MVYAIVAIGVLQLVFDVVGLWYARRQHGHSLTKIGILERENLELAQAVVKLKAVEPIQDAAIAEEDAKIEGIHQRLLTLENKQQKIAPRPKRVNFREFRDAAERASEPEEAE